MSAQGNLFSPDPILYPNYINQALFFNEKK